MSLDMSKCKPSKPYHVPVSWVKEYGKGRMFYTNLGHNNGTWKNQQFLDSTAAAVRWVLGKENGDATANPEVSKAWHAKCEKDAAGAGGNKKKKKKNKKK